MDLRWPCGDGGGVCVFIDGSGYAKHIGVGPSIDDFRGGFESVDDIELRHAADLMGAALELSESSPGAPVGEGYPSRRGFLRCQLRRLTAPIAVPRNRRRAA